MEGCGVVLTKFRGYSGRVIEVMKKPASGKRKWGWQNSGLISAGMRSLF